MLALPRYRKNKLPAEPTPFFLFLFHLAFPFYSPSNGTNLFIGQVIACFPDILPVRSPTILRDRLLGNRGKMHTPSDQRRRRCQSGLRRLVTTPSEK